MRINREPGPDPALRPQQLVFRKPFNCPPHPSHRSWAICPRAMEVRGQLRSDLASPSCFEHPKKNCSSETAE